MYKIKKSIGRLLEHILENDIILRIYFSFSIVLILLAVLIGVFYMRLYEKNYLNSYTETQKNQCELIAKKVSNLSRKNKINQFEIYTRYIDQFTRAGESDLWIVANLEAENPLKGDFTNAGTESLTDETYEVLQQAYKGKTVSDVDYDDVYGMVTLRVVSPVYSEKYHTEASGAVMLVSMLDRQKMGVREGKRMIAVSILAAFLIAYITAIFLSKYISRPLEKIDGNIMKMEDGDYSEIKKHNKRTQLGRLEFALDKLSARLRQIQQERENLDHIRQDFFANVSHELRTPLTVIRGYTESLTDGVVSDPKTVEEYHARMLQECKGMQRLVGDLFILSKMQNPDFEIEKEPVSLLQILADVIKSGKTLGNEKNISIISDYDQEDPWLIVGDYDRLRQVFMIIVDNAVKFSENDSQIAIHMKKISKTAEKPLIEVCIADQGVGISEEQLPFVFEKFYKSKLKQNEKGTGLGLMIAKQIVLKHNGKIWVESELNKGSRFYFQFVECSVEEAEKMYEES